MKILALMSSALAENSAGRATFNKVLKHANIQAHEIKEFIMMGKSVDSIREQIDWCDLLIVVASPFHFGIQAQAKIKFLELNSKYHCFENKLTTFFLSSGGGGDQILERELELLFKGFGARIITGFSCIDYSIFDNQGIKPLKTDRSGNNVDDMSAWLKSLTVNLDAIDTFQGVLVLKVTNDEEYYNKCFSSISKYYKNVKIIDIPALQLHNCIGCKLCYTVKKQCIFQDAYLEEVAAKISSYKKVFFIANMEEEGMSPMMDNLVQRNVAYGLYPSHAEPQHNIYFFKTNGASVEAVEAVRFHFKTLNSMEMNWYNIYFDEKFDEEFLRSEDISGMNKEPMSYFAYDMARTDFQVKNNAFPNVTGWSRMFVRHFARLINMIKNLLPVEYKFYARHPMAKFVETDENIRPILNKESLKTAAKFKIATIEEFDTENYQVNKKGSLLSFLFKKK